MATSYALHLRAQDGDGEPAGIEAIADVVARWARLGDPLEAQSARNHRGGSTTTTVIGAPGDPAWAWRLNFAHSDSDDEHVMWNVSVDVVAGESTDVYIKLGRTRTSGALKPLKDPIAPPRLVRALLEADSLWFFDGGWPIVNEVKVIGTADAEDLSALVLAPDRRLPVVGITLRDDDPVDAGRLLPKLAGLCHIAMIRPEASWELDRHLPRGFNVYGGATRVWWPGVRGSQRWDHDLWTGDIASGRVEREVAELVTNAGLLASMYDRRLANLVRRERDRRSDELIRQLADLRKEYADAVELRADNDDAERAAASLEQAEKEAIRGLQDELAEVGALAEAYARDADDAAQRASRAERERDFLRGEVDRLRSASGDAPAADRPSPEDLVLCSEIEQEIKSRGDVDGARERLYSLGGTFVATVDQAGPKVRSKIVKACADVVLGSPGLLGRRDDHVLRTGASGNAPPRIRSSDGAEAHRCYVEHMVASARRLHYWLTPQGEIVLASVNLHDDMHIPE